MATPYLRHKLCIDSTQKYKSGFRDTVRSSDIQRELGVELLLLHVEMVRASDQDLCDPAPDKQKKVDGWMDGMDTCRVQSDHCIYLNVD